MLPPQKQDVESWVACIMAAVNQVKELGGSHMLHLDPQTIAMVTALSVFSMHRRAPA